MNFDLIVKGLGYVIEHRKEIASDAEAAIHFIRRVEHMCVHHNTTADTILVEADKALSSYLKKEPESTASENSA